MSMGDFNWSLVDSTVNKARTKYEYETHKHLFKKVAFDTFKPIKGNSPQPWELRQGEDGKQYLFALYDEPEELISTSAEDNHWAAIPDKEGKNITLAYKNIPIHRICVASYGYDKTQAEEFASFIEKKAESKQFVDTLLNSMSEPRREAVKKLIQGE